METYKKKDDFVKAMQLVDRADMFTFARANGFDEVRETTRLLNNDVQFSMDHPGYQRTLYLSPGCWVVLQTGWWEVLRQEDFYKQYEEPKKESFGEVNTVQVIPETWEWAGEEPNVRFQRWLGPAYLGYTESNVPGEVRDEYVLSVVVGPGAKTVTLTGPARFKRTMINGLPLYEIVSQE